MGEDCGSPPLLDTSQEWLMKSGWWQLKHFLFLPLYLGEDSPFWLIFFRWVGSTTNQKNVSKVSPVKPCPGCHRCFLLLGFESARYLCAPKVARWPWLPKMGWDTQHPLVGTPLTQKVFQSQENSWGSVTNHMATGVISFTRWWFQIFCIFTPKIGEDVQFDEHIIFQMGWWKTTN